MDQKRVKRYLYFIILIIFIILWSQLLYLIHPETIVESIGLQNIYIITFFIGAIGGTATVTVISYYPIILTLAFGGGNPIILGIVGGLGLTLGNILYYYFGLKGKDVMNHSHNKRTERILTWINKRPAWMIQMLIFVYVGLTPLPNNILTMSSGLTGYPFKRLIVPLVLGNVTLTTILSLVAIQGAQML